MQLSFRKNIWQHVGAIAIFLIISILYCHPAMQGKVLQQSDIMHWKGMAQNAFEYKQQHGHFPLWNTHLFSGMPNYQVAMENKSLLFIDFNHLLSLWLPKPVQFFFLACLSFYILCMAFQCKSIVAILGSLAFAYCSYNPIIISVGHETKMMAIAYMPALLAGLILLYEKKYVVGFMVTALFATLEINANHPQINYYFLIAAVCVTLAYLIKWIQQKQWKHAFIALLLAAVGALVGVGNSAVSLLTTAEYAQYTMRGGKNIAITNDEIKQTKTTGLDEDYAFSYSIAKAEFLTFLMPHAFGESSSETFDENSKIVSTLTEKGIPENTAVQLAASLPKYWGGIESTAGPVYLGAIICLLFIVGMVVVKDNKRWWILIACIIAVFMAWGKYFPSFNQFLFQHLPLYNKFRAPSMALVIPQLLFPLLAVLAVQQIFFTPNGKEQLQKSFKRILQITAGIFVILLLIYLFMDYSSPIDANIVQAYTDPQTGNSEWGKTIVNALLAERKAMFGNDIFRAFLFAVFVIVLLWWYQKNASVKAWWLVAAFAFINFIDLLLVDTKYLNADSFVEAETEEANFIPNAANLEIMKDKDVHYRVYSLSPDRFNESITAYFHRCIGGYHPAKLRIYQDLIETQLSKNNMNVLNMLDTRYFILPPQQQQNTYKAHKNDSAYGACWLVKNVHFVNGPVAEIQALDTLQPLHTAVIDQSFQTIIPNNIQFDSTAQIKLTHYDNDTIHYDYKANTPQLAVFSEIYYPAGWNAYIDNKKVPYCKANYVLRALPLPAGVHKVSFIFEPSSYYNGQKYVYIANIILWLSIIASIVYFIRNNNQPKTK